MQDSEPKQADLIAQLAKHEIEIFPDSQFGGKEVSAFGEGVNQCCSLIGQLNGITTLDLANTDVDDRGFAQLCKLTTLRCLRLTSNHVTEKGLLHARAFEHLVELHVQKFPVKGLLEVFCRHPNLEVFSAIGCNLNEDDMIHLAECKNLRKLLLNKNPIRTGFRHAAACKQLEMIETTNDVLDLEGAREFALLPGLRRLYLNHTPVDDEMFAVIGSLGNLAGLALGYTRLTPASSTILSGLTNLTDLMWPSSAITLLNVNDFSVLTNLKELQVVGGINDRLILDQINRELCKMLPNCYVDVWDI